MKLDEPDLLWYQTVSKELFDSELRNRPAAAKLVVPRPKETKPLPADAEM